VAIVVVGGGQAAAQICASLRSEKYTGEIILITDEPYLPYQRPPLSKQYLAGEQTEERLFLRSEKFYEAQNIQLELGQHVSSINRTKKEVTTESGKVFSYTRLVLCTGSRARKLNIAGSDLKGIHYLRSLDDVKVIRADMQAGKTLAIVGGGYIGLEVGAVAIKAGLKVTIIEMEKRILKRVTTPELSEFYHDLHTRAGINILTETAVSGFVSSLDAENTVSAVCCASGPDIAADLVIVGIGIIPNIELAMEAEIECENGILVDDHCCTSDKDVYAVGDCTNHPNGLLGRRLRLESVPNAMEQARVAAANIQGNEKTYCSMPWFWSDQYDLKLQMSGFSAGADQHVTRGSIKQQQFLTFHLKNGVLVGVDSVNSPKEFLACKKLVEQGARKGTKLDPSRMADASIPINEIEVSSD